MKIVVWNCNMAFHEKWERLLSLQPDIAVIPECADVEVLTKKAPKFNPTSSLWIGDNRHKGLGVFTFGDFAAARATIYQPNFPYIAPVHIDGPIKFNLLAVWACHQTGLIRSLTWPPETSDQCLSGISRGVPSENSIRLGVAW